MAVAQGWRRLLASLQDALKVGRGCWAGSGGSHSLRSFHHRLISFEPPARRETRSETRNSKPGTWNSKPGTWNLELGTSLVIGPWSLGIHCLCALTITRTSFPGKRMNPVSGDDAVSLTLPGGRGIHQRVATPVNTTSAGPKRVTSVYSCGAASVKPMRRVSPPFTSTLTGLGAPVSS
jgi:hypothetical protein